MKTIDLLSALACVGAGILLSVLPHLAWWREVGEPVWVADHDEVFYLQVGSQAYFNHPVRLADPVRAETGASIYKPLPLVPGVLAARAMSLGPQGIGLAWRIWAGATIGLAWFFLARHFSEGRAGFALALAILLMADGGLVEGRPLIQQAKVTARIQQGHTEALFRTKPVIHPQWRISTPGVTMAYLILFVLLVAKARDNPTLGRIAPAGIAYGLLFHVYFYYWTAATLALGIVWLFDAGHRKVYLRAGLIGLAVGLPSLVSDVLTKRATAPDWLLRTDKFLPIGHFRELMLPAGAILIVAGAGVWVWSRRRDLAFLWSLATAGLLLTNHQVATGLQIENFHWIYVWGPCVSLLIWLLAIRELGRRSSWSKRALVFVSCAAMLVLSNGLWLRWIEARQSGDSRALTRSYRSTVDWLQRNPALALSLKSSANGVVSGGLEIVDPLTILHNLRPLDGYAVTLSSSIRNEEWDERRALNAALRGLSRSSYESAERLELDRQAWGPWWRDPALRADRLNRRLAAFDRFVEGESTVLDTFQVRFFVGKTNPPTIGGPWKPLNATPTDPLGPDQENWTVWERTLGGSQPLKSQGVETESQTHR